MLHYKKNSEILEDLDEYVEGHIEAKKALINLVNRSKMRHYQKYIKCMDRDFLLSPSKVLLIGASGTGKTHLVESLHKIVDFPFIRIDATKLNPTGASGGVKEESLRKMIVAEAQRLVDSQNSGYFSLEGTVDQMVVFVDEIDKLGRSFESSGNWNDHVQSNFLSMFDNKAEFSGVSFIFAGAFTDITHSKKEVKSGIGFTHGKIEERGGNLEEAVVKAGLLPELVGRINAIVSLDKFTEDEYYNILVSRIIPRKQMDLAAFGIFDTKIDEEELREIARNAHSSNQGIRCLQRSVEKLFLEKEFYYEEPDCFLGYYE